jgi:AbrB family looped-hinge helix DNA binding protein
MKAIVSEKGQVTIPKRLRERLGIRPGQVLDFEEDEGKLVAQKVVTESVFDELYGIIDLGMSTDEFIALLRDEE